MKKYTILALVLVLSLSLMTACGSNDSGMITDSTHDVTTFPATVPTVKPATEPTRIPTVPPTTEIFPDTTGGTSEPDTTVIPDATGRFRSSNRSY